MKSGIITYSHLLLLVFILTNQTSMAQETRAGLKLKYNLSENISSETLLQIRNEQLDNSRIRSYVGEYELNYTRFKYIKPGIAFRYKYKQDFSEEIDDQRNDKYRLSADLKLKIPENIDNVSLTNRMRYQYSVNQEGEDKSFLRNEFTLGYKPVKSLKTYVSPEIFYNLNKDELDRLRFQFGVDIKLSSRYEIGAYYIAEMNLKGFQTNYITALEITVRL